MGKALGISSDAIERYLKTLDQQRKFTEAVTEATHKAFDGIHPFMGLMPDLSSRTQAFRDRLETLSANVNEFHRGITIAGDEIATVTIPAFAELPHVVPQATAAIRAAREELEKPAKPGFLDLFDPKSSSNMFGGLSDIFQRAFEGGGGVGGAVKSYATQVTANALKMIPVIGETLSQFAGRIVAGLSSLFHKPEFKKQMKDVSRDWGVSISEGLGK
jgi:hypothetical protein